MRSELLAEGLLQMKSVRLMDIFVGFHFLNTSPHGVNIPPNTAILQIQRR